MSDLKKTYQTDIKPKLKEKLALKNVMMVPKLSKITINVGVKEAIADKNVIEKVTSQIGLIVGQKPAVKKAKKAIAGFKLREGDPVGVSVTLRGKRMYDFWEKRHQDGKLFVLGMYRAFPYHPRDHVFWGNTEDVRKIFAIPFDPDLNQSQDYRHKTRAETYIGQFYYARFDPSIDEHIKNPLEFTVDGALKLSEALEKDFRIRDRIFSPFPRISMEWPKQGLKKYHYHIGEQLTEYWGEDD